MDRAGTGPRHMTVAERRSEVDLITRLVGGVDGVVAVENQLSHRFDDTHRTPAAEARVR